MELPAKSRIRTLANVSFVAYQEKGDTPAKGQRHCLSGSDASFVKGHSPGRFPGESCRATTRRVWSLRTVVCWNLPSRAEASGITLLEPGTSVSCKTRATRRSKGEARIHSKSSHPALLCCLGHSQKRLQFLMFAFSKTQFRLKLKKHSDLSLCSEDSCSMPSGHQNKLEIPIGILF